MALVGRVVGHAGHAVHLFRSGVERLCVVVVLLLLRCSRVVHGFSLGFGCFWFGLGHQLQAGRLLVRHLLRRTLELSALDWSGCIRLYICLQVGEKILVRCVGHDEDCLVFETRGEGGGMRLTLHGATRRVSMRRVSSSRV
jgi:hypothetical protein